jgi:hypothetical protein
LIYFVPPVLWIYPNPMKPREISLDQAVFAAYGWESGLSDEEILEKLLALNLGRAKA